MGELNERQRAEPSVSGTNTPSSPRDTKEQVWTLAIDRKKASHRFVLSDEIRVWYEKHPEDWELVEVIPLTTAKEQVKLLPETDRADADTEFAFVDGLAFVNAAKHEEVVARRVSERDTALEQLRQSQHAITETLTMLLTIQGTLQQSYEEDPRWSPWTRWVDRNEGTPWRLLCDADERNRAALDTDEGGGG